MIAASEARERSYGILNVLDDINDKIIQATKDKKTVLFIELMIYYGKVKLMK